ncbi:MAG TPA: hypothetical protein VLB68_24905 [Pyrinomonadaceae bacterium]|nr:hypothetical protein [Pyrinomonadaceae bacterium]
MSSSRREFLKRGTLMALATGVPLGLSEKASTMGLTGTSNASGLSLAAFKSQIDTTFLINHEGSKVEVKLIDVTSFASRKQSKTGKEGFSLLFHGPKDTILKQNTYLIEHEKMGMFSFLIVPTRVKNKPAPHYEAVVNRLYP